MARRHRRWSAVLLTGGLVFAQLVTVAHACTLAFGALPPGAAIVQSANESMLSDCPEMAKCAAATAKVCEAHCAYGKQIDVQPAAPVAAFVLQPGLTLPAVPLIEQRPLYTIFLSVRSNAPPVSLLFGRFLA